MSNATELAGIINLDALNKYNAEQVEAGYYPINIRCAYDKVQDLVNGYAGDLAEAAKTKALEHIQDYVSYHWTCFEGNTLDYAEDHLLMDAIGKKAKEMLF